ncbi:MAG: diacylglycerol kinase family lipid kinase [Alphaproteobacteria bacterium]|nr:diacylglycerol kinase family lipid kinase [Alphaproteobacteria bacterium]MDE1986366.1 diacylglycerol kinase family lipid kinase [Alphaproteobacteria bacterium]MDE2164013.1 diacylglycerol kinase family lipid kinase [Alphaproteobacteria bacterium]MDE2266730.1 diacylglycerol kinase family lipid kinase [Alphaproteobacteria bacterium]MDE2499840.1 diacylglycerol kinase family lipid kinase [Alphaproteobacteria bacterium]
MSAFVVVNPRSGNGGTRRGWRALEKSLSATYPYMTVAFTKHRGDATNLVNGALREGHLEIVAVGGDGTINEAVNGFFDSSGAVSPDAVLAFVSSGTGGDFKKAFGVKENGLAAAQRLKHAAVRPIDIGRVSFLSKDGVARVRYFANIGSFGLSGKIVDAVNHSVFAKLFGGTFAFAFHSAAGLLTYHGRTVRLIIDDVFDEIITVSTVAVANGTTFGGGMMMAPGAKSDDGFFDVVLIANAPKRQMLADMKLIYTGEHLGNPNVRVIRGRKVVAAPVAETHGRPVLIETDGEGIGRLPATFEILPRALNVRC